MNQRTMSLERRIPPNSKVVRRLDFGGDNFEAEVENFINLTNEVVQMYSKKYNFDFTNEIAHLGRYLWSKRNRGVGWVSMEVKEELIGNEITSTQSRVVTPVELTPTHSRPTADAVDCAPLKKDNMPSDDKTLEKGKMPSDDKTSEKRKMPMDDKTSKKKKTPRDDKNDPKSHVKKRLIME